MTLSEEGNLQEGVGDYMQLLAGVQNTRKKIRILT